MDGTAVVTMTAQNGSLLAEVSATFFQTIGTHQITVLTQGGVSNALPLTVYVPAQGPQPFLAASGYYAGGTDPNSIAVADFNGDGLADVAVQGPGVNGAPNVAIFYGQKDGTLSAPQYISGVAGDVIGAADVDGDGRTDLVTFNFNGNGVSQYTVLLNDGGGNFHVASSGQIQDSFAGGRFNSFVITDVDGDGKPDILISGFTIFLLRNLGGGQFSSPTPIAVRGTNGIFAVADFNGDGLPDIAYNAPVSTYVDQLHVLINSGNGTFRDTIPSALQGVSGYVNAGDFNGDGRADLVVQSTTLTYSTTLEVFSGLGNGNFLLTSQTPIGQPGFTPYRLVAGDFDHDGHLDLAGVNGETEPSHVLYLWGDGNGNFTPQQVNGPQGHFAAAGDINGDGIPDVVVPDRFQFVSVSLGQIGRNYPSPADLQLQCAGALSAASAKGNGQLDLLSAGSRESDAPSTLYLNQGDGTFQYWGFGANKQFLMADVDGDGIADLIGTDGQNVVIWPGLGNLLYGQPITIPTPVPPPETPRSFQVIDMDKDGHLDLVAPGFVLFGKGNFQFDTVPVQFSSPFVVGDFNNDGLLDIVHSSGTIVQNPGRTFSVIPNSALAQFQMLVAADFNSDGNLDIAGTGAGLSVYYGRGDGTFWLEGTLIANETIGGMAAVDFTGDGRPDIVAGLQLAQQVALFSNDGQGGFARSFFASGAYTMDLIEASFRNANKPDLAVLNYGVDFRPPNALVILHK